MSGRIDRLNQLNEWLDAGTIDQSEYEDLKKDLFASPSSIDPEFKSDVPADLMETIRNEVTKLQEKTFDSLGVTREELEEVDRTGLSILQGGDLFTKGVEAHTRMVLRPGSNLRNLVELKPGFLPVPIYMGVTQTIETMIERLDGLQLPLEVKGFMATYSMLAWESVVESGIAFDPGEGKWPADFFKLLGVDSTALSSDRATSIIGVGQEEGLLPGGFLPDGRPHEVFVGVWESVPTYGFLVQKLGWRGYEWRRNTFDEEGSMVIIASGIVRSERKAEEQLDSQMADLAIECVQARDAALTVASTGGYVPRSHHPSFQWGPIDDVDERGYAIPMGIGIWAKYGDSELPLARVGHHEIARKLILSLAVITGDERGVEEIVAEESTRQWVKSIVSQSRRGRR